jgi:hypothetical protein
MDMFGSKPDEVQTAIDENISKMSTAYALEALGKVIFEPSKGEAEVAIVQFEKREDSNVLRKEGGDECRPQVREAVSKLQFSFVFCVLDSCSGSSRFREMNLLQIVKS